MTAIDETVRCTCGHPKDDHYPPPSGDRESECWAGENDPGDEFCPCGLYEPATTDTSSSVRRDEG